MIAWFALIAYIGLCISLLLSDFLLTKSDKWVAGEIVEKIADVLLFIFPNCLFPLLYGMTNSWAGSMLFVGIANIIFFYFVCKWMRKRIITSWVVFGLAYIALSLIAYGAANYAFFALYFMKTSV